MSKLKLSVVVNAVDRVTKPIKNVMKATNKLTKSIHQQKQELSSLSKFRGDIDKFKKLRTANKSTAGSLVQARQKAALLKQKLISTAKPTAKLRNEFDRARKSVQRLEAKHKSQRSTLAELKRKLEAAGYSTRKLGKAEKTLEQNIDKATRALEKQNARMQKIQNAKDKMAKGLGMATGMVATGYAAAGVGRAAGRILTTPIQTASLFEEAMDGVGAVARATSEQLDLLTNKSKELGASTRYSASEVASGMKYLAMAGFSAKQINASIGSVLDMTTAAGPGVDLAETSDIASDILSAFKLQAKDMSRVADTLTATFTRSNTSITMLGETMKYVGPVAREAGLSLEQTAAMAGLLGNVGIKSSMAGTTLRQFLLKLASPTTAASKAFKNLGIETKSLNGDLKNPVGLLGELAEKLETMGGGDRLAILSTLFDARAAAGVSELIGQEGAAGITKFTEVINAAKGESRRVAKQMSDNAAGGFRSYRSAMEGLQIAFGDLLLPAVKALTAVLTGITRKIRGFVQEFPTLSKWVGVVIAVIAGLAFALSGLMTVAAGVVGSMVVLKFGLASLGITAIPSVIAGIKALGLAIMTNPIGLLITGIALGAALIIANWDSIGTWFSGLWDGIKNTFLGGWELFKTVLSFSPLGLIKRSWQPMFDWISNKMSWVGDIVGGIKGFFGWDEPQGKTAKPNAGDPVTAALKGTPATATVNNSANSQQTSIERVQIYQQPGEDGDALADKVLKRLNDQQRYSAQGMMYDG